MLLVAWLSLALHWLCFENGLLGGSGGKTLEGQPPISELILNPAQEHLSEEVLLRTPEESYERKLHEEQKRSSCNRSEAVAECQSRQKEEGAARATSDVEQMKSFM
jgi:hypothetical protein